MIELPEGVSRVDVAKRRWIARRARRAGARSQCPEPVEGLFFVYMLICLNGTLYVGQTRNVRERLARHKSGTGARHTRQIKEFSLVYTEGPITSGEAIHRERQLKKWSRAKKLALIRGDTDALRRLSRSQE
jgi:putative endonuclease